MRRHRGGVGAFIIVIAFLLTPALVWAESTETAFDKAVQAYDRGDYSTAFRLFSELSEQGDPHAQFKLGFMYEKGHGVTQDHKEAVRWFRLAAEQGYPGGQFSLGRCYYDGRGVPQDDKEAVKWYRPAAEQGDPRAQVNLGRYYAKVRNAKETVKWHRLAAEQGNPDGQVGLGYCYAFGLGMPKDYVLAHMWFNLCAANSTGETHEIAMRERDIVASKMTQAQIEEAQRLAGEWKPK